MTDLGIVGVGDATLIASGGSALVYRAVTGTGEAVAVKVLRGMRGAEVARRFEREQSAAERLQGHPHIISILDNGITPAGEPYLVMPLIPGGSLADELDVRGRFDLRTAIADVAAAAAAIGYAHDRGVLHRDIKPGNLLRADDGSIIVSDFGIARVVDAGITSATVGASTPLYAAPELLAENDASPQSDVYALGALLYTLLAGVAAFADSQNIWGTMHRIRIETPPSIPHVPAPVMRVIEHAMAKDPHDRPASAAVFRDELLAAYRESEDSPAATTDPLDIPRTAAPQDHDDLPVVVIVPDAPSVHETVVPSAYIAPPTPGSSPPSTSAPQPIVPIETADFGVGPPRRHLEPPPAPPLQGPAAAVGTGPRRESSGAKIIAAVAAIAVVAGLGWFAASRLLEPTDTSAAVGEPVDTSLPSPGGGDDPDTGSNPGETTDSVAPSVAGDDTETGARVVSFTGAHFSALLPEGWSLLGKDVDVGYGYRSMFLAGDMYLNIDTTPKERRESDTDIATSARDIAAGIDSASEVSSESAAGLTMHSFTFRNTSGVDSIDIFFEVDGDGYAIVAGSPTDPEQAFETARQVALSVRSNP